MPCAAGCPVHIELPYSQSWDAADRRLRSPCSWQIQAPGAPAVRPMRERMPRAAESIWECLGSGPRWGARCSRASEPFVPAEPWAGAVCGWRETRSHRHSIPACDTDAMGSLQDRAAPGKPLLWGAHRYSQPCMEHLLHRHNRGNRGTHCHVGIGPQTTQICDSGSQKHGCWWV